MNERQPSPEEYNYSKEELEIPNDLKMNEKRINELTTKDGHEEKIGHNDLYRNPYFIAERIREIKEEYYNPKLNPGAERKTELMEEYENLKSQRQHTKEQILENAKLVSVNFEEQIQRAKEERDNAQKRFDLAQQYSNDDMLSKAKYQWQTADDFIRLFEEKNMPDLNLEDEDEGLKGLPS